MDASHRSAAAPGRDPAVGRRGLLLVNLGTPDAPETGAVRRYLREFLWDGRVLDIPAIPRALLLYGAILPFRPQKSAAAYREIWDAQRGSPLLYHGMDLRDGVAAALGEDWVVDFGMRYGRPTLEAALDRLEGAGCTRIFVLALYPHYASSSTGSTRVKLFELAAARPHVPALTMLPDFYEDVDFIEAQAVLAEESWGETVPEHVLFSFHGVPERQVTATDLSGVVPGAKGAHCLARPGCCDRIGPENRACYRAQCYATARALARRLQLAEGRWSVSFQSRLGRTPWIQPFTDEVLPALAQKGVKRIAVLTPSFVADCLETIEEIGIRAVEDFTGAGGEELVRVPCVNTHPRWVQGVVNMVRRAAGEPVDETALVDGPAVS